MIVGRVLPFLVETSGRIELISSYNVIGLGPHFY